MWLNKKASVKCIVFIYKDLDKITFFVASENHFKGLEVASSSYHKILEENRVLYNQVQDLKGVHLNLFNLQLDHLYVLSDMKLSE